jgi:sulfate adenylyltransferase subunit 1
VQRLDFDSKRDVAVQRLYEKIAMDILRFITAGSIDDGKSTLIGRLLLDTGNIKNDILESVKAGNDSGDVNLAFITDGLRAERLAGITIDVAYKYFTTPQRKFIITDAPGHFHYTKNLVTGASGVDAMIILIDATIGISMQTLIHSMVASFLGIPNLVVAINKMDLAGYDEAVYTLLKTEYNQIAEQLKLDNITYIPMSALEGDNVTSPSVNMPWYKGDNLLQYLEECKISELRDSGNLRMTVQYVANGFIYGKVVSGTIKTGEKICINGEEETAAIKSIIHNYTEVSDATAGQDICLVLAYDKPVNRGDILTHVNDNLQYTNEFEADLCWLDETSHLQLDKEYIIRITSAEVTGQVKEINSKTVVDSSINYDNNEPISVNEFARIRIRTHSKVAFDNFNQIRETGRGILIDKDTNNTSGALIFR